VFQSVDIKNKDKGAKIFDFAYESVMEYLKSWSFLGFSVSPSFQYVTDHPRVKKYFPLPANSRYSSVSHVDLTGLSLAQLPRIVQMDKLEVLCLANNNMDLPSNNLAAFKESNNLPNLEVLTLDHNKIHQFEMASSKNLSVLLLDHNSLNKTPKQLENFSCIRF